MGREGLFELVKTLPDTLRYDNHVAAAFGEYVILHGRFSGHGLPAAWIVADILRLQDEVLAEHWNGIQDEATREQSWSGLSMSGDNLAPRRRIEPTFLSMFATANSSTLGAGGIVVRADSQIPCRKRWRKWRS
jgi:hypothetical protein